MKIRNLLLVSEIFLLAPGIAYAQSISTVQFVSASYSVNENAGSVTLTVQRIGPPGGTAYVEYETHDGSTRDGEDYGGDHWHLQFNGETNLTIEIPILNDAVAEPDETFSITLFNPEPFDTELGTRTNAVVTIHDNDRGVEFSPATYTVDEMAGMAVITVLAPDAGPAFSVDYSTSDGCNATVGLDYEPQNGRLNFAAGETEKTIVIPILDDALVEGDETVGLSLSHPVGVMLGVRSNAVLWIRDNDSWTDLGGDLTPQRVGIWSSLPTLSDPQDVAVSGNYVYVADGPGGMLVIDASDATRPRPVGRAATRSEAVGIAITCNDALVAESPGGLEVFDVSNPMNPRRVGQFDGGCSRHTAMGVEGSSVVLTVLPDTYCGGGGGLDIIDLSDPANPQKMGEFRNLRRDWVYPQDVAVSGDLAYLGTGGWFGLTPLQIIDLSDPSNPQKVGESDDPFFSARALAVSGNFLYIAGDASLGVFSVSDAASPQQVGTYAPIDIGTPPPWPLGSPSRLAVAGGRLYVAGWAGLEVIDIRDPAHPRHSAFYKTDAEVMAVAVRGDQAFLAKRTGLEIIDLNPLGFRPGSITRLVNGQVKFPLLNTRPGRSYTVQASTNLVDWESLETRTASNTKLTFTDTNAPTFSRRFYRAVSP